MQIFLITFLLMLAVVALMSIGYIFQKKKIKGSCGGISDLGLEKVCDCEEPCDKRKELMKRLEKQRLEEQQLAEQRHGERIEVKHLDQEE